MARHPHEEEFFDDAMERRLANSYTRPQLSEKPVPGVVIATSALVAGILCGTFIASKLNRSSSSQAPTVFSVAPEEVILTRILSGGK